MLFHIFSVIMFCLALRVANGKNFPSMRQLGSIKLSKGKEKLQLSQDITYFLQSTTSNVELSPSLSGDISIQYFAKDQFKRNEELEFETSDTLEVSLNTCEEEELSKPEEVSVEEVEKAEITHKTRDVFCGGDGGDHSNYSAKKLEETTAGVPDEEYSSSSDATPGTPMGVLRNIWRDMMLAPPTKDDMQHIIRGERTGFSAAVPSADSGGEKGTPSSTTEAAPASTDTHTHHNQLPLRANGTDHESLYRQILSQFMDPLAMDSKRSLWLDQEFALNLKGSVVIAHQPELWKGIGDGLKPKLTRGLRLVTPYNELNTQGPTGITVVHSIIAAALSHSVGASMVHLNLRSLERVREIARNKHGVPRQALSKANILTALLDACEEVYVETARPSLVVFDDHPKWLLSNEAAAEVVLDELKSISSRVMFIAVPPEDALYPGDFAPSACPAPVAPPNPSGSEAEETAARADMSNPFASFANLFNAAGNTGTGTFGMPHIDTQFPASLPPSVLSGLLPPSMGGGPSGAPMVAPNGALIGRSFQVIVKNGTATMIPLQPTMLSGMPSHLSGGLSAGSIPSKLPDTVLRKVIESQQKMFPNHKFRAHQSSENESATADNTAETASPQQFPGISFPLFPPDMTQEEIADFMQDPDNQAKIKQTLDTVVQSFSQHMAEQFGRQMSAALNHNARAQHQASGQPGPAPSIDVKVQVVQMPSDMTPSMAPFGSSPRSSTSSNRSNRRDGQNRSTIQDQKAVDSGRLPGPFFSTMQRRSPGSEKHGAGRPGGAPFRAHSSNKRTPATSSEEQSDETSPNNNAYSPSGMEIVQLFEEAVLMPPRDVGLRTLWDRLLDEQAGGRILRANRRLIHGELKRNQLKHSPGAMRPLEPVLRRQVMSREDVQNALRSALKLQAGKHDAVSAGDTDSPASQETEIENAVASATAPRKQIILSQWALDTALSAALNVPTPRLGKPVSRSKEDISALVTDKHERSLIGNVISPQNIGVTYDMIGGLDEVKELLRQCVTYPLKYPRLYQEGVAAEAVKGVLLFGPPGTGKTMLAKAVATEGGATFLTIDTSTIENKWLGESEKNARAVFALARRLAPCVIYLDEVDSILSSREQGDESSHGTLTSVKTTLMQEWDGLRTTKDRVVVIASTNRPFDLDEAVLRRLPRRIMVDLPDLHTRQEILSVTLANNRVHSDVNFTQLAEKLEGYTGSDIKEVCREAVVRVAHERAHMLEHGVDSFGTTAVKSGTGEQLGELDFNAPLRPVRLEDFQQAMKKLKASVNDNSRELQKVVDWNNKYGEFKRKAAKPSSSTAHMTMYV